jgi:type II secretory pathway pseudopilin PulG
MATLSQAKRLNSNMAAVKLLPGWLRLSSKVILMRRAITLVELLVVIFLLGILGSILLGALMRSREEVRKISCNSNIRQIGLALQNYASVHEAFPLGAFDGDKDSFFVALLPFLEQDPLHRKLMTSKATGEEVDSSWAKTPRTYQCPSDPASGVAGSPFATNYLGVAGGGIDGMQNGIFVSPSKAPVSSAAVTDGTSNTIAITETAAHYSMPPTLPKASPSNATFRTTRAYSMPSEYENFRSDCFSNIPLKLHPRSLGGDWMLGSIGITRLNLILPEQSRNCSNGSSLVNALLAPNSLHALGVNSVFADGSTRYISQSIDQDVWQALGSRNGGEINIGTE